MLVEAFDTTTITLNLVFVLFPMYVQLEQDFCELPLGPVES